jgi:hypothetical protein
MSKSCVPSRKFFSQEVLPNLVEMTKQECVFANISNIYPLRLLNQIQENA